MAAGRGRRGPRPTQRARGWHFAVQRGWDPFSPLRGGESLPRPPGRIAPTDFREDKQPGIGIEWGLHIKLRSRQLPFLERFTCSQLAGSWHLTL